MMGFGWQEGELHFLEVAWPLKSKYPGAVHAHEPEVRIFLPDIQPAVWHVSCMSVCVCLCELTLISSDFRACTDTCQSVHGSKTT